MEPGLTGTSRSEVLEGCFPAIYIRTAENTRFLSLFIQSLAGRRNVRDLSYDLSEILVVFLVLLSRGDFDLFGEGNF